MSKTKIALVVVIISVIGLSGWGLWAWSGKDAPNSSKKSATEHTSNSGDYTLDGSGPNGIPLSPGQPSTGTNSGLRVAPSSGSSLAQLVPEPNDSDNAPKSMSEKEKMLDPTTFSQYDKYKGGESALYAELVAGTGAELTGDKKAAVYYKGWLTNGQLFDMSRANDKGEIQPFVFQLGARQVIPGWEQGLTGMKVGGVRFVIVPPAVGYGAAGQGSIPGNAVLIFQVQLLEVE